MKMITDEELSSKGLGSQLIERHGHSNDYSSADRSCAEVEVQFSRDTTEAGTE